MAKIPPASRRRYVETDAFLRMTARILTAAGRRVGEADEEELRQLLELEHLLDEAIVRAVRGLRAAGATWDTIGAATGTTRQGAQQRWGARLGTRPDGYS